MTNEVKPMKITNHEKINMRRIVGNSEEYNYLVIKGTWNGISGHKGAQ